MRKVHEITAEEENFRAVDSGVHPSMRMIKRDPVEPEPIGTIVVKAFRVTGYDSDCDGSLMARLEQIDKDGETTGWCVNCIGIGSNTGLVATQEEWNSFFR